MRANRMGLRCRHCGQYPATRARGLCWRDYEIPAVRALYPPTSKYAYRGEGNDNARLPAQPTDAPPGSPEKAAVLALRAAAGEQLFHPADARLAG